MGSPGILQLLSPTRLGAPAGLRYMWESEKVGLNDSEGMAAIARPGQAGEEQNLSSMVLI